jgi:hypothetical protein
MGIVMNKYACIALVLLFCASVYAAETYLVIEGRVKEVTGNYLIINEQHDRQHRDQHFPVSVFAQVYNKDGRKMTLQNVANAGSLTKAKIYVLRGKVERIEVEDARH